MLPATSTRIPEHTAERLNRRIHHEMEMRAQYYSGHSDEIGRRLEELPREWDIERLLGTTGSVVALVGLLLAIWSAWWLILPGLVLVFLLMHAVLGWSPPALLFRRMGIRTQAEIDEEMYVLKALRGDFRKISQEPENEPSRAMDAIAAAEGL